MNRPEINVTPLIDVLLVLLIIFMIVSPLKPSQIEARVPGPDRNPEEVAKLLPLFVSLESDGKVSLGGLRTYSGLDKLNGLTDDLRNEFESRRLENPEAEIPILIKAPRSITYGKAVLLIDAVKLAGADPVILQIDSLEG